MNHQKAEDQNPLQLLLQGSPPRFWRDAVHPRHSTYEESTLSAVTPVSQYLLSFLIAIAKQQGINLTYLYSALSSFCACGFSSSSCLCAASSIQRRNCTPGHDMKSHSLCSVYPYEYQMLKDQMAWIYKLYYR